MNFIIDFFSRSWPLITTTLLTGLISGISTTLLLVTVNKGLGALGSDGDRLTLLALSFTALCLIVLVAKIITELLLLKMAQRVTMELRLELSRKIITSPFETLEKLGTSKMFANLISDISTLTSFITSVPSLGVSAIILLSCFIYLGTLSWKMLILTFSFILFGLSIYITLSNKARVIVKETRNIHDHLYKCFQGVTHGVKELQMHYLRRDHFLNSDLKTVVSQINNLNLSSGLYFILARNFGMILFFILIGVLIFVAPQSFVVESDALRGYVIVILYLIGPLQVLLSTYPSIIQAKISLHKITDLGASLGDTVQSKPVLTPGITQVDLLSLRDIEIEYEQQNGEGFKLGPLDIDLIPGEIIFLTGGNGSGKSSFAKVLVGLYQSKNGSISINNTSIDESNMDWYRQHFTVLFSDYYLFENIGGLQNRIPDKNIESLTQSYLRKLELNEKVKIEDGKFSTTKLSMGQRKRLALLIAYLENRPIYVFDEWAADQDPAFKKLFYTVLLEELKVKGKIVFVISHDDQYFHVADRLLKMDYGKLAELSKAKAD
ncbi:MAG: cyclic peptide export ABC transporter [Candidatus Thiodiazotropha endolucinida]